MIDPQEIIAKYSIEELNKTADDYFKTISDPIPQINKPFSGVLDSPAVLQQVGLLLSGLKLGKTMTVLDFACGTCWLSRYLNQMQCHTISCDVSASALEMGKQLFETYPIIGTPIADPEFLVFDGYKIDLPDESVDRIICIGGFHHVPNQEQVLAELGRVLRKGGIAGFAEPGPTHSQSPQSQYEMRNYTVLENDIIISDIFKLAQKHQFTNIRLKILGDVDVNLPIYRLLTNRFLMRVLNYISPALRNQLLNQTIFFLHKGNPMPDSRSFHGLVHTIELSQREYAVKVGEPLQISLTVNNIGGAKWLDDNIVDIGIVKIGTHLYDAQQQLLNLDFSRHLLDAPVLPGETIHKTIEVSFPESGTYHLGIDLVSEGICWFENVGAKPEMITVQVQES